MLNSQEQTQKKDQKQYESQKEAANWIKQNILEGGSFKNDFRSKYFNKLGIQNGKSSEPIKEKPQVAIEETKAQNLPNIQQLPVTNQQTKVNQEELIKKKQEFEKNLEIENSYQKGDFSLNFMIRTNEQIRNNYLQKLINQKILKTDPSKKQQTIIIYDWDDTLLCTTYLGNQGFIDLPLEIMNQLSVLDNSASKLLAKSLTYGDVFIITNAAQGWVEYSGKLYFPKVNEVLQEKKIQILSARQGYEEVYPGDCHKWKIEAFKNIKKSFDENIITNLICLGDSNIEMEAAHALAKQFNQVLIKTIKFRENPKPDELVKQQELVNDKFEQIYVSIRNLTIRLEKKSQNQDHKE